MRPRKRRPTFTGGEEPGPPAGQTEFASNTEDFTFPIPGRRPRRGSRYAPSSFVERWIHRSSPSDEERPMLRRRSNDDGAYDGADDDFGVGIPIEAYPIHNGNMSAIDSLSLKSKPSTRRSSVVSSIDDVWHPMDDEEKAHPFTGAWPDTGLLDEFASKEIQEQATAEAADLVRESVNEAADAAKGGRLRPRYAPWERNNVLKSQSTMRFTYFRDDLEATVHSPSIAGLLQPGQSFADLFPQTSMESSISGPVGGTAHYPPVSKFSSAEGDNHASSAAASLQHSSPTVPPPVPQTVPTAATESHPESEKVGTSRAQSPAPTALDPGPKEVFPDIQPSAASQARAQIPSVVPSAPPTESNICSESGSEPGPWWLDINCPTEDELRAISRAFGVHPLTTEDIVLHETREKVEIFHNYYFVCFTSFDVKAYESKEDERSYSDDRKRRGSVGQRSSGSSRRNAKSRNARIERLKPLAVFSIVFKTGIITVHYRPTPHTINVRRRIRLLRDYLNVTSDWISYALIDDITDGYGPLISAVDEDVQGIEDAILRMHGSHSDSEDESDDEKSDNESHSSGSSSTGYREWREKGNMLRWIGECRKRVMSLLSLLSNKADVIKGFAKRVSDQWSGAPRSEIAMYLSDIQDHLVTMTQSLNHYEKLLARSHSNYLAQINIDMTRTNNEMNDVLGKISVLGTIVLPMNIVTGLWGMNVLVPGQGVEDSLAWFWSITIMMGIFGISAYFLIMRYV